MNSQMPILLTCNKTLHTRLNLSRLLPYFMVLAIGMTCITGRLIAQTRSFALESQSPTFWELIDHKAQISKVAGDFGFTEGPVWDPAGFVWVSDETLNKLFQGRYQHRRQARSTFAR